MELPKYDSSFPLHHLFAITKADPTTDSHITVSKSSIPTDARSSNMGSECKFWMSRMLAQRYDSFESNTRHTFICRCTVRWGKHSWCRSYRSIQDLEYPALAVVCLPPWRPVRGGKVKGTHGEGYCRY